jgi:hypothetical protein
MKATVLAFFVAAMAVISSASVQAGVVFSNLTASGLVDASSATNTDILANNWIAAGFTTGTDALELDWVSIVAFNNDVGTKTVALYSDNINKPGTLIATSAATTVSTKAVYQFNFSGASLAASTKYWVLPQVGLSWYVHSANAAASAQNSSGFTNSGFWASSNSGSLWGPTVMNYTLGVSASPAAPVPEPAITSLVCVAGIAFMRRRMKK